MHFNHSLIASITIPKTSYSKSKNINEQDTHISFDKKSLPTCSSCGYRRKPYSYTLQKKVLCKICSIEVTRVCKECKKSFPAGRGTICSDCIFQKSLNKKVSKIISYLSPYTGIYFVKFTKWLSGRRGVNFTSVYIEKYQEYFFQIDTLCQETKKFPTYEELLNAYPFATSKSYFLIHTFLAHKNLIKIDKRTREKYANLNLIDKLLNTSFATNSFHHFIKNYHKQLQSKLQLNSITYLTMRLSLSSAVKYLQYCEYFKDNEPSMYILEGYLWIYPGQRNSLTEFTNFLKHQYNYNLTITNIKQASLSRPHVSHQILQKRFLRIIQTPPDKSIKIQSFYKVVFGYLHWIFIPNNVYLSCDNIKKNSKQDFYIQMCAQKFYLPKELVQYARVLEKIHTDQLQEHALS